MTVSLATQGLQANQIVSVELIENTPEGLLGQGVVMMRIEIAQRLRPFTHRPATVSIMPGTGERMMVYPTQINHEPLPVHGPVKGFTHQIDMEKGALLVFGHAKDGYFQRKILSSTSLPPVDRLFLGVDKAQDWELIRRRADPAEYLPFWYRLGQMVPSSDAVRGTARFLQEWRRCLQTTDREGILEPIRNLFLAGFDGILAPRLIDSDHHGFGLDEPEATDNPLALLSQGAQLIRQLFVSTGEQTLHLLPVLPPEFQLWPPGRNAHWTSHTIA